MSYLDQQELRRAEAYPDDRQAIGCLYDGYARLIALGWRDDPPPENRWISWIERGSTTVHTSRGPIPQQRALLWKPALPPELTPPDRLSAAALAHLHGA
jgi:hypothetical protein